MNNTKTYKIGLLSVLAFSGPLYPYAYPKTLFVERVIFPGTLETVPTIRAFYAGRKISGEVSGNSVTFSFPEMRRNFFYLLISHDLEFGSPDNTISCLKLKKSANYKFYALELVSVENKKRKKSLNQPQFDYTWNVKELSLSLAGNRIPDDTVIVWYNPDFIKGLEGGNLIEFPKIIIRPDIVALLGSEEKLHNLSNQYLLSALNLDTIHDNITQEIAYTASPKTILALTT
jgi:hypothetical protein